jgi:hypothetical protein
MVTALNNNGEATRESELIFGSENLYGIYQLKLSDETKTYAFKGFDNLLNEGLSVDRSNYELVYTAPINIRDTSSNLHKIIDTINSERPENYTGRDIMTSDVIVLQWRGSVTSCYVDDKKFINLPSFLGNETPREHQFFDRSLTTGEKREIDKAKQINGKQAPSAEKQAISGKTDNYSILKDLTQKRNEIAEKTTAEKNVPKHDVRKGETHE